ncbi:MAG: hypothetical protein LBK94_12605 [Prevotellaceae bacterium]|jgi:hypothetical protein|nr:hypothetical protein [Prevotellaceae bacterium]
MNEKQLQLVTFKQAKRLKALGFRWECETFYCFGSLDNCHNLINYNNNAGLDINEDDYPEDATDDEYCSAPTVALALKWFRGEKEIESGLAPKRIFDFVRYAWWYSIDGNITATSDGKDYEAAESALLNELLTILEKKKEQ